MESWKEVFVGEIPKDIYPMQLINGEKQELNIELEWELTLVIKEEGF